MLRKKGCRAILVRHVLNYKKSQNFFLVTFLATREAVFENSKTID